MTKPSTKVVPLDRDISHAPTVAYVFDPRFPGGTSSAIASELRITSKLARIKIYALCSDMFSGRGVAPQLRGVLTELRVPVIWDAQDISADVIIFHNPACLKFQDALGAKMIARHLIVVTHENVLRPGGAPAFDVEKCLGQISDASIALQRHLAPVSAWNRAQLEEWLQTTPSKPEWDVLGADWFNICDAPLLPPTRTPRDRRGRHSRPGFEKFPNRKVMSLCFPETAESNIILGADSLMRAPDLPDWWTVLPFGSMDIKTYFEQIDFMVYFTAPTWRESFGRVIAEAIAAGKIVLTDPDTALTFQGAAIATHPEDVDDIIAGYIAQPERYRAAVRNAQETLQQFGPDAFQTVFMDAISLTEGTVA